MRRWYIKDAPTSLQIAEIATMVHDGKVVLLPTDTIYGLHTCALSEEGVGRIVEMKGREDTKPFLVIAGSLDQLADIGIDASVEVLRALDSIWPAPLTVILPLREPIPASRGASTLGVRVPALDWLRELALKGGPLVSTSANRSGEAPATSPESVARDLHEQLDGIIDGGVREGKPSAILDLTGTEPRFIREGEDFFTQKVWKTLRNSL